MAMPFFVVVDKVYGKGKARYHGVCELDKKTGVRRNVDSRGHRKKA